MANDNETIADILREMRGHERGSAVDCWYTPQRWRELCDRIEAAHRREVGVSKTETTTSDAARMRNLTWCTREIDLIAREMRAYARDVKNATDGCSPDVAENTAVGIREFAERLEDLSEELDSCEHQTTGDAARMRDVVTAIAYVILPKQESYPAEYGGGIVPDKNEWLAWIRAMQGKARAALSAPPRNCDIGTAEEQTERMRQEYCERRDCFAIDGSLACPLYRHEADCRLVWAQMPYEAKDGGDNA